MDDFCTGCQGRGDAHSLNVECVDLGADTLRQERCVAEFGRELRHGEWDVHAVVVCRGGGGGGGGGFGKESGTK